MIALHQMVEAFFIQSFGGGCDHGKVNKEEGNFGSSGTSTGAKHKMTMWKDGCALLYLVQAG